MLTVHGAMNMRTDCSEPVDDKVDEQCVIVALNWSFIPYFAWSCYRTV